MCIRDSTSAARTTMRRRGIRHLVVVDEGRVVGIVSERDFGRVRRGGTLAVQDVMSRNVVSATPATTFRQAANLMRGHTIGCLLVVEDDELLGLVTTTDLLDQLGRGATRPTVRTEAPPLRSPPGSGRVKGSMNIRGPTGPRGGRRPRRQAARRDPLPTSLPRQLKLSRDRSGTVLPPAHIRVMGAEIEDSDRKHIARKLGMRLGKFASSIERVTVRLSDVNGPRGGQDQVCQVKVVISGVPSIVIEERDSRLQRAVDRAINATALAVRRSVQRRRMKPLRKRRASAVE